MRAGYPLIGENRVQEVVAKAEELSPFPHETHFIGHLQANKINQLVTTSAACRPSTPWTWPAN